MDTAMSITVSTTATDTAAKSAPDDPPPFGDTEKRVLVSRMATPSYAAPATAGCKVEGVSLTLTCLPMVVVKADNLVDKAGAAITVAQCQWSVSADITFLGDNGEMSADAFVANARKLLSDGSAPLRVLEDRGDGATVTVWYGACVVGVNPSKGRGFLAAAIAACLPATIAAPDVATLREGIAGEATRRNTPDVASKVSAAVNTAQAATIAAMVAAGVNPDVAAYLGRGEALPTGWTMAGPPVPVVARATGGRK